MSDMVPFNPQAIVTQALNMAQIVYDIRHQVLKENVDFGAIVDGGKPTLLKPGAEKLASAFKLSARFNVLSQVEDWPSALFFYRYECVLVHRETAEIWGSGIGSCNSNEEKYGFRWVAESRVPSHLDTSALPTRSGSITEFEFAIDAAKTPDVDPKYGKPAEYWQAFKDAIASQTAVKGEKKTARGMSRTWSIGGTEYRVPNINVFDTINTIDKMAQKRALVAAVLVACNASAHFTQDIEDFDHEKGNALTGRGPMVKPTITVDHWSTDDAIMERMYAWAMSNHEVNVQGVKAAIAATGRPITSMSGDEIKALIAESAAKKKVSRMSDITEDEFTPPNGS